VGYAVVRGLSDQLSSARGNDAGARRGGRPLNTQSLGGEVCPAPGRAIPGAETSGRSSWRMDETYVRIKGVWKYLYRAVDKAGATVDFLLTAKRDRKAALRFLRKAIGHNGTPEKITIDKSGANTAAIESYNKDHKAGIEIRQVKYLNNIVEQDHRAVKRLARPMLGFKSFRSAQVTLTGIELMHMIRKGQLRTKGILRPAQAFYSLAA
jgi:putative transposase